MDVLKVCSIISPNSDWPKSRSFLKNHVVQLPSNPIITLHLKNNNKRKKAKKNESPAACDKSVHDVAYYYRAISFKRRHRREQYFLKFFGCIWKLRMDRCWIVIAGCCRDKFKWVCSSFCCCCCCFLHSLHLNIVVWWWTLPKGFKSHQFDMHALDMSKIKQISDETNEMNKKNCTDASQSDAREINSDQQLDCNVCEAIWLTNFR